MQCSRKGYSSAAGKFSHQSTGSCRRPGLLQFIPNPGWTNNTRWVTLKKFNYPFHPVNLSYQTKAGLQFLCFHRLTRKILHFILQSTCEKGTKTEVSVLGLWKPALNKNERKMCHGLNGWESAQCRSWCLALFELWTAVTSHYAHIKYCFRLQEKKNRSNFQATSHWR